MSSPTVTYFARWISLFHFFCFLLHRDPLTKNTDCIDLFKKGLLKYEAIFWRSKGTGTTFSPSADPLSEDDASDTPCADLDFQIKSRVSPCAPNNTKAHLFLMAVGVRYIEYSLCITLIGFSGLSCEAAAARRRRTPLISSPVLTSVCSYFSTASHFLFDLVLPA